MSLKSSPTKKDDKTLSPTKKDDKASSSVILTRTQSTFLNTRQLRNKDSSRRKISEFTRQLLSPSKEKKGAGKKKSPKEKKEKEKGNLKKPVVVSKLELEEKEKSVSKKRKIVSAPKVAKRSKTSVPTLSAQELIVLCEEQSLDDEDFMEILTCESPVWWEDHPDDYSEDTIFGSTVEKRYFQEIFKQMKPQAPSQPKIDTTNITIPTVKQTDDKFMKKRSKLENLLGNIKNKLNEPNVTVIQKDPDINILKPPKANENKVSKNTENSSTKETVNEIISLEKTPSEGTSSSDDMFFGFQNEDVLKDLENMDIPIEPAKENNDAETNIVAAVDDANLNDNTAESKIGIIEKNDMRRSNTTAALKSKKTVQSDNIKNEIETDLIKVKESTANLFLESSKKVHESTRNKGTAGIGITTHNVETGKNSVKPKKNEFESTSTMKNVDSCIIYVEAKSSKSPENNRLSDKKTKISNIHEGNEKSASILENKIKIKKEPDSKLDTKIQNTNNDINKNSIENNKKVDTEKLNDTNKSNTNSTVEEKTEVKSNKSKNFFKDQLLAVYKTITNENYRNNLKKTIQDEFDKEYLKTKVNSPNNPDSVLLNDNNKCYLNRKLQKKEETDRDVDNVVEEYKNNEIDIVNIETNPMSDKIDDKETNLNDNESLEIVSKEILSNDYKTLSDNNTCVTKKLDDKTTNAEETNQRTECEQKNNKVTNLEINSRDPKDDELGKCDNANEETSLNIVTSKVQRAKYCLKCSSIFETDTCIYCAKKSQGNLDNSKNGGQQSRKSNV